MPRTKSELISKLGTAVPNWRRELGSRLKSVLDLFETRKKAAEVAGVTTEQLATYVEGGAKPPFEVLHRLADAKRISLDWLASGRGAQHVGRGFAEPASPFSVDVEITDPERLRGQGYVLVPRVDVRLSAGGGAVVHTEQVVDYLAFKEVWIRNRLGLNPRNLLVLEAAGDSMEPTISDGDIVLVDVSEQTVRADAIYALVFGEGLVVKRLRHRRDGAVEIISDNPRYGSDLVPPAEIGSLRVIGRIRWSGGLL